MNIVPEDLYEGIKGYLVRNGFNSDLLDKDINNSPPSEDYISEIINEKIPKSETILFETHFNDINSMIRSFKLNNMLPKKMEGRYSRGSMSVLEEYTKENNIEYDFISIDEYNLDKSKIERSFIIMIDSNEELIQFEEMVITHKRPTIDVLDNEYLIPAAKRMVRNQKLKELLGS